MGTRTLSELAGDLCELVRPLFAADLDAVYRARQAEAAERWPGPEPLRPERIAIGGPTAPLDRLRAVFEGLTDEDRAVVWVAGRLLWLAHARDGEAASDFEAFLTVLAGCTTWETWEHRGGGCHWNGHLWPDTCPACPDCTTGYIDDGGTVDGWAARLAAGQPIDPDDGVTLGSCVDCGRTVTVGEFRGSGQGRNILIEAPRRRRELLSRWPAAAASPDGDGIT